MDTTDFFMSKTASVYNVVKKAAHSFKVDVKHPNISVAVLYGSSDVTKATITRFDFDSEKPQQSFTTPDKLEIGTKVWVFTFLLPKYSPKQGWLYKFGIEAGEGGEAAQIGLGEKIGDANTLPPSLGAVPRNDLYGSNVVTPPLSQTKPDPPFNVWTIFEMQAGIHVELDAEVFLVNNENNIIGYWGSEVNVSNVIEYGVNKAGAYFFICLVKASQPLPGEAGQGGYHFHVGDPRKDAVVTVSEGEG
ncbi:MAG: hypothetical protein AB8H12_14330 [Lewinella sp.]